MSEKNLKETLEHDTKASNWQAQKSAMTRDSILTATIECFIKLGYNKLTTAKVADTAGVSRGAMRHHFASKQELIKTAIEQLHKVLLEAYLAEVSLIPPLLTGRKRIRSGLGAYWKYINGDHFRVYQELCIAARTEPELKEILDSSVKNYEHNARKSSVSIFTAWEGHSDRLLFAIDTAKFMMEGMANGQVVTNRDARIERQLDYLAICVEDIFNDDGTTEISKYFSH